MLRGILLRDVLGWTKQMFVRLFSNIGIISVSAHISPSLAGRYTNMFGKTQVPGNDFV